MNRAAKVLFFVSLLLSSATAIAQQRVTSIKFEVRDAATAEPVIATVYIDGTKVDSEYKLPDKSESRIAMEVLADAGVGYYQREMNIFLEVYKQNRVIFRIYLAPRNSVLIHNRASVTKATRFLQHSEADRALALLEAVATEASAQLQDSQFGVYLKYNLWRAYFVNCTQRFVDYCSQAAALGNDLLRMSTSMPKHFFAERISTEEITRCSRDISDNLHYLAFHRASWDLRRGRPEDALESLVELEAAVNNDPRLLDRLKIDQAAIDYRLKEAKDAMKMP